MQPVFYPHQLSLNLMLDLISCNANLTAINEELVIQLYRSQLSLTEQLMANQKTLSEVLEKQRQTSDSSGSSMQTVQNFKKPSREEEVESLYHFNKEDEIQEFNSVPSENLCTVSRLRRKRRFNYSAYLEEEEAKQTKKCQTKNIIKNFVKSVFSFIRKRHSYRKKVLTKYQIDQPTFLECLDELNDRVHTIQELRDLWLTHQYCQVFRIFSSHFLRKYYINHIFNSRIVNYPVHLKYRVKLQQSLKRPEEFTILKEF